MVESPFPELTAPPRRVDRSDAVCVVGAGPAGLAAARALRRQGIDYDHVERHSDVGGLWDIDNPGSPMYESAHLISSRTLSGFLDHPMPDSFPDYPSHRQILAYLRSFADAFGLRDAIRFGTSVTELTQERNGTWLVATSDGALTRYGAVIAATGAQWAPNRPTLPGRFDGEILHSVDYRSPESMRGRRVLVVGAGNSGCDIASDIGRVAERTWISVRRGYWFIPKHVFGIPSDVFADNGPTLPMWLEQRVFGVLLRLLLGDVRRLGLPRPDHRLFESHPILNSELLSRLQHGDVVAKPDVARLDGPDVVFADGSREQVDVVLLATGYRHEIPWAQRWFGDGQHPDLYLSVFSREHRNLFGIGYVETNSGAYPMFDAAAHLIACYLADQRRDPGRAARFADAIAHDRPDLTRGIRFVGSPRHTGYVDSIALHRYYARTIGQLEWPALAEGYYAPLRVPTPVTAGSA